MQATGKGMDGPVCGARCKLRTGGERRAGRKRQRELREGKRVWVLGGRQGAYSDVEPIIEVGLSEADPAGDETKDQSVLVYTPSWSRRLCAG